MKGRTILADILVPVLAVLMVLGIVAILILISGVNPLTAYWAFIDGAFGNLHNLGETAAKFTPLLILGLAISVAYKCHIWNMGAEGQMYIGALAAVLVGLTFSELPAILLIPLLLVVGFLGGAFWGAIPGLLKAKLNVNEIISTLMLNFIAILFVSFLVAGPIKEPGSWVNYTSSLPLSAQLPRLVMGTRLHAGFLISLICFPIIYVLLEKTVLGHEFKAVGLGPEAAHNVGINVSRNIVIAMIISGGLAGVAGIIEISALHFRLLVGFSPWYGFTAIVVALLGRLHPVGVTFAAIFFASLMSGGEQMHRVTGLPFALVAAIQGMVLVAVLISEYLVRRKG